ncbi:conserved hypothetical protein [uncultured Desulfatiglans sp.]|nr:conserved hypothetical protein [uncultured Desulfatiglans sp.]
MLSKERNRFEKDGWILQAVEDFDLLSDFDCDEEDLNDFFQNDCSHQQKELLNVTFALIEATQEYFFPVALISLSNDAIRKEKIPLFIKFGEKKDYPSYPAVKIARFGVRKDFQRSHIGRHVMNMVKEMFITNNRTGCRFLTLDAYNEDGPLSFYQNNDFQFFNDKDKCKKNRAMFFDLKRLVL